MLALGAPFLCGQHPDRLYTGRGVDFTPFGRPLPLTIWLVVDARRLALDHGVALAGPVVVSDLCFSGSTYDQVIVSYKVDGTVSQTVGAPAQAVGADKPEQVVAEDKPDQVVGGDEPDPAAGGNGLAHAKGEEGEGQAEVQLLRTEPLIQLAADPGMPLPIPFSAFPLDPANLSHPLPTNGASLPQVPTPDYYALFKSFSDTELVGVWAVHSDLIVPPADGRSLHNLLEDLQLGIDSSGALLEWQGKGVRRKSLLAILRFSHCVQAQSFLFRVCQLTQVHFTTNLPSGRIPTGSGIALSPFFEGAANKERVEL
jgi:hypothetical protein